MSNADKPTPYGDFKRSPNGSVDKATSSSSSIRASMFVSCGEHDSHFAIYSYLEWPVYFILAHIVCMVALLNVVVVVVALYCSCRNSHI